MCCSRLAYARDFREQASGNGLEATGNLLLKSISQRLNHE